MTNESLNNYKNKLNKERALLTAEVKRMERPVDFGDDIDHGDEESDETEEVGNQLAIAADLKNRLSEIDLALGKIQSGKYGVCEEGGEAIEPEILDIDPESRYCKRHKLEKLSEK